MTSEVIAMVNDLRAETGALRSIVILLAARELADREPGHVAKFGSTLRESMASARVPDGHGPIDLEDLEDARHMVLERLNEMLAQLSRSIGKLV